MLKREAIVTVGAAVLGLMLALPARQAQACGGLFCSSSAPVSQAAERIVFVENGDGTVTAVIEIQYQGPSENFSWVLPVPGTPEIGVSSTAALDRLQAATNPQYTLQTTSAGCPGRGGGSGAGGTFGGGGNGGSGGSGGNPAVIVLGAGSVGPFDYEIIGLDPDLPEPADVAINWLDEQGYDVTALGPAVLGPYLENGLNLLAFRLSKSNDAGSIRPVVLTYTSEHPYIPIRPTAVAANDDMGILVWVVSSARAVPDNYKALELNEALINWFNPMSNYDAVVSAAADEAAGQGFVTEFADSSRLVDDVVLSEFDDYEWNIVSTSVYQRSIDLLLEASYAFGTWDGFEDALRSTLTLPDDISFSDLLGCPSCYADNTDVILDQDAFRLALYENVYKPMVDTQALLNSRPYVTRFYTTMSADEMTMDPAFNVNAELHHVSNIHTAEQQLDCETPGFRVTLEDGTTVYGTERGIWPVQVGELPAARKVLQLATRGQGAVVVDNSDTIAELLGEMRPPSAERDGGTGEAGMSGGFEIGGRAGVNGGAAAENRNGDDCAASGALVTPTRAGDLALALLALGWIAGRRRR